jgi:hypothetical protein
MAVLSKAGCNQGACHGNANGKNGFKLSLRGEDPAWDLAALTHDSYGRRIDRVNPSSSLILLKATGSVPHEGGRRFELDSPEYEILSHWLAGGARPDAPDSPALTELHVRPIEQVLIEPADRMQIQVRAKYSDGSERDVTHLCCFEPASQIVEVSPGGMVRRRQTGETSVVVRYLDRQLPVRLAFVPKRSDFVWRDVPEANFIDKHVFAKLRTLQVNPSQLCSDSVFLRRSYLDCIGMLPSPDESQSFLSDSQPGKRARLIDKLLAREEFSQYWALKWSDLLRNEEKTLDRKGMQAFHRWIRQSIADGKPLNEFARELIAARGSTYSSPAANYYRAHRNPQVRAETTAQVFLGLRMQCAKCHNHPFDRWSMDDYYSFSAFFARVQYKIVENYRKDGLDQHEFDGEQVVWIQREGEVENPRSGQAASTRFLGSNEPLPREGVGQDRLQELAGWVAGPDNPFFARAQVNRIWYHVMGRGIVEPIDDFRISNPPVIPELLEALAADFVAHGFDLRQCIRAIMNSRTYQLSAVPNETNRQDESNFSHAIVRPLQAEALLDAYAQVSEVPVKFNGYPLGLRAASLPGVLPVRRRESPTAAEEFLKLFGKPDRLLACECERSDDTTLGQAFQLISGEIMNRMISSENSRLSRLLDAGKSDAEIIHEFYLASVCRAPNDEELRGAIRYVEKSADRRAALEDLTWGLFNAKEFLLRQ